VFHQASEIIAQIKLDNKHKTILQQKLQKFIGTASTKQHLARTRMK
jgi:hypothetical protein